MDPVGVQRKLGWAGLSVRSSLAEQRRRAGFGPFLNFNSEGVSYQYKRLLCNLILLVCSVFGFCLKQTGHLLTWRAAVGVQSPAVGEVCEAPVYIWGVGGLAGSLWLGGLKTDTRLSIYFQEYK